MSEGENIPQSFAELGSLSSEEHISVDQMYVQYLVPRKSKGSPVVMVHGMALTGKTWETTPDGRMGWQEYFVREGHPVFVIDQVGRGRSGFNQRIFNRVRTGLAPPDSLPAITRFGDEMVWPNFRFGTRENEPLPNQQFPVVDLLTIMDSRFGSSCLFTV